MEIKEILSSGMLEMYCMGHTSPEENRFIEELVEKDPFIKNEIASIFDALDKYSTSYSKNPPAELRDKILKRLDLEKNLPPLLTEHSDISFWNEYLNNHGIFEPEEYEKLFLVELPSTEERVTYIVWGKHGSVEDDPHVNQDEYLLVLNGSCTIKQNGVTESYKKGDLIFIPKNTAHLATVTSSESLLVIGQRIAA